MDVTICEARHIQMLKDSLAGVRQFAVCMLNEMEEDSDVKKIPAIATLCKVINFDQLEGGLLSIALEGTHKVRLLSIRVEDDGLMRAKCTYFPNWDYLPLESKDNELAEKLKVFYQSVPEIGAFYPEPEFDDLCWVCQRWIEVLPLEVHYKQLLITQDSPRLTVRFLHKLFLTD
ncbi:LON peptidase substrate-binding domain-containing protein [Photobacterium sp. GSS17]|uniref:LON peptidase substrate-binding domain-containing protein n=1 Tax=Photobacterium TaxID=657 RepID=UPI002362B23C|nr:LON peptidase substrate-binding domain-containing protein [Photobacterium sp. GSS17]